MHVEFERQGNFTACLISDEIAERLFVGVALCASGDAYSEIIDRAIAEGGPLWLYLGNRELVMSYPDHTRRMMVQDVELDSPTDAQEMARDVLKEACAEGPNSVGMGTDLMARLPR